MSELTFMGRYGSVEFNIFCFAYLAIRYSYKCYTIMKVYLSKLRKELPCVLLNMVTDFVLGTLSCLQKGTIIER